MKKPLPARSGLFNSKLTLRLSSRVSLEYHKQRRTCNCSAPDNATRYLLPTEEGFKATTLERRLLSTTKLKSHGRRIHIDDNLFSIGGKR